MKKHLNNLKVRLGKRNRCPWDHARTEWSLSRLAVQCLDSAHASELLLNRSQATLWKSSDTAMCSGQWAGKKLKPIKKSLTKQLRDVTNSLTQVDNKQQCYSRYGRDDLFSARRRRQTVLTSSDDRWFDDWAPEDKFTTHRRCQSEQNSNKRACTDNSMPHTSQLVHTAYTQTFYLYNSTCRRSVDRTFYMSPVSPVSGVENRLLSTRIQKLNMFNLWIHVESSTRCFLHAESSACRTLHVDSV